MAAKKQVFDAPKTIECAFAGCPYDAITKVKKQTGWANVCRSHYLAHYQAQAEAYCQELGLDTPAKCREWLKSNRPAIKKIPAVSREPGEDWGEVT